MHLPAEYCHLQAQSAYHLTFIKGWLLLCIAMP